MAASDIPAAALQAVKDFLKFTLDAPNEEQARRLLSSESRAQGMFHMPDASGGASYTIGDALLDGDQLFVPVTLKDAATSQEITMPLAPVLEDGSWKLDMVKMTAKLMGGVMGQLVDQMGNAMGAAMEGLGDAMTAAFGGESSGSETEAPKIPAADLTKFEKQLAAINEELPTRHDLHIRVDIDLPSLLSAEDETENHRSLEILTGDVLRNFVYAITEANREVPLEGRLKAIRLEGVREARDRVLFSEGARIIYRLSLRESDGFYDGQELAKLFTGIAAGMPENAPPGPVENKPSYRPTGDSEKIVRDYREFVLPTLTKRIAEMLGHEVEIQVDWDQLAQSPDDPKAFWIWGLNRVCGALALLTMKEELRPAVGEAIQSIRIMTVPHPGMKSIEMNQKELLMYFSPDDGEKGAFYETEIAELLSKKLKLRTRPMIAELEKYAKTWEKNLAEYFDAAIQYAFDWDGFTCYEEEDRNAFALTQLREKGIEWMAQALIGLGDKNPNFKQQLPQRVRWIYLEHSPRVENKSIRGEQTTLALKLFLHEGYDGYLTLKQIQAALPKIVAEMPDIPNETPPEPAPAQDSELAEFQQLQASEQALAALREWTHSGLARFSESMKQMTGNPLPVEMDWESFSGSAEELKPYLEALLKGVLEGLAMTAQMPAGKSAIAAMIDEVVIHDGTDDQDDEGFSLDGRILTFTANRENDKPPLDPAEAMHLICEALEIDEEPRAGAALTDVAPNEDPNDRAPQPYIPDPSSESPEVAEMRAQFDSVLPVYAQQLSLILGKPITFEIDWASVTGGMVAIGQLLNAALTPTLGGLAMLVSDPARKSQATALTSRVLLRQTTAPNEHGFSLNAGTLTYTLFLSPAIPPTDPQLAATLIGAVLDKSRLAKRAGSKQPPSKAKSKPKPKAPPPKAHAKPATPKKKPPRKK